MLAISRKCKKNILCLVYALLDRHGRLEPEVPHRRLREGDPPEHVDLLALVRPLPRAPHLPGGGPDHQAVGVLRRAAGLQRGQQQEEEQGGEDGGEEEVGEQDHGGGPEEKKRKKNSDLEKTAFPFCGRYYRVFLTWASCRWQLLTRLNPLKSARDHSLRHFPSIFSLH